MIAHQRTDVTDHSHFHRAMRPALRRPVALLALVPVFLTTTSLVDAFFTPTAARVR